MKDGGSRPGGIPPRRPRRLSRPPVEGDSR
jgi:hypothetical protein